MSLGLLSPHAEVSPLLVSGTDMWTPFPGVEVEAGEKQNPVLWAVPGLGYCFLPSAWELVCDGGPGVCHAFWSYSNPVLLTILLGFKLSMHLILGQHLEAKSCCSEISFKVVSGGLAKWISGDGHLYKWGH